MIVQSHTHIKLTIAIINNIIGKDYSLHELSTINESMKCIQRMRRITVNSRQLILSLGIIIKGLSNVRLFYTG